MQARMPEPMPNPIMEEPVLKLFTARHAQKIRGVLSCYDRVVITGTCPALSHAQAVTSYFYAHHIRIFDYPKLAEPFRDEIRAKAERLARDNGLGDRIHPPQQLPQGGTGQGTRRGARRPPGAGSHLFGHGAVQLVQAVA